VKEIANDLDSAFDKITTDDIDSDKTWVFRCEDGSFAIQGLSLGAAAEQGGGILMSSP